MPGTSLGADLTSTVTIHLLDAAGLAVFVTCEGAPPSTANVFAKGCQANRRDAGVGTSAYVNTGTSASPTWTSLS